MNAQSKVAASLASDMVAAFTEIEAVTKAANNPHFKSKYADLTSVIEAIRPVLARHNLCFTQQPAPCEDGVSVETVLHHASGDKLSLGTLFVPANKKDAQGFGSALTYARRYALVTAFGVPTEDDDGNAASRSAPRQTTATNGNGAVKPITDDQRDIIQTLAPAAGKTIQGICAAYRVPALTSLTEAQAVKLIDRLQSEAKEPANA
jgi:hypothetical protein